MTTILRVLVAIWVMGTGMASAQDRVWLQVEAQPDAATAEDRARAYGAIFPDVTGYRLRSGWYAIVLGPYDGSDGVGRLAALLGENLIPNDSYIVDDANFVSQFWPGEGDAPLPPVVADPADEGIVLSEPLIGADPTVAGDPALPQVADPAPLNVEETPAEARRAEAALSREEREALQSALKWYGFYQSTIDGAFGPGTRNSMADWQTALGYEPTGILTSTQRATLIANYEADQAEFGFSLIEETKAGISIILPAGLVEFDHYDPPFVHFREKNGSGVQVILISQPGDQTALIGLYDVLQSLKVVPLTGERSRGERSFSIKGSSATVESTTYAETKAGLIKGYMLITKPGNPERDARILDAMQSSFSLAGDTALDPGMVAMTDETRKGLLAGLEVRKPAFSRSGFFIDAAGTVLTTSEAVTSCGRITLERDKDVDVVLTDPALGIAVLKPRGLMAAPAFAAFQSGAERLGADVAVSGYSYEDRLTAPVLTFGTLEDTKGLKGETGVKRLALTVQPGDAGGPVLDGTGAVLGMLLPAAADPGQSLPDDVAFAGSGAAILARLARDGITAQTAPASGALAPEDLARRARDMTVLVSCWD